jgi:hypothetical protein
VWTGAVHPAFSLDGIEQFIGRPFNVRAPPRIRGVHQKLPRGEPYAGDVGGIVCHIVSRDERLALFISLTHVRMPRRMPLAAAVVDYQKHRVKKLRQQVYA